MLKNKDRLRTSCDPAEEGAEEGAGGRNEDE